MPELASLAARHTCGTGRLRGGRHYPAAAITRGVARRAALCLLTMHAVLSGCQARGSRQGNSATPANSPLAQLGADSSAATLAKAKAQLLGDTTAIDDGEITLEPTAGALTAVVMQERFTESVSAPGIVAPRPGHYAEVSAPAIARVTHVYVAVGDRVTAGAPLADLDRTPFDAAVASAGAALTLARHAFDRAQQLSSDGTVAHEEVDQAAADVVVAESAAVSAQRDQQLATVRAPLAGIVTRLSAVLGATTDSTQPLAGIADPDSLDLVFDLAPAAAAGIQAGDSVAITAGPAPASESLGVAVVTARDTLPDAPRELVRDTAIDIATRTVTVRAHPIQPADARTTRATSHATRRAASNAAAHSTRPVPALHVGEAVFGRIAVAVHDHATTVPVQALAADGDGVKVFVVGADGLAHSRPVVVGGRTETTAEITDGLRPGETIVTAGASGVEARPSGAPAR